MGKIFKSDFVICNAEPAERVKIGPSTNPSSRLRKFWPI